MHFILLLLFYATTLFSLSSLPYDRLNKELLTAQNILENMNNNEETKLLILKYTKHCNQLKSFADEIISDNTVNKNESKEYLRKLRELNKHYEELLLVIQNLLRTSILQNDYYSFLDIVNSSLPKIFEKKSLQYKAVTYYKLNAKLKKSKIMELELKKFEIIRLQQEEKEKARQALYKKKLEEKRESYDTLKANSKENIYFKDINIKYLNSSSLSLSKYSLREKAFTKWMTRKEYEEQYSSGYYKKTKTYPAYIEANYRGNRRVIQIKYEPKFYWISTSGRQFNYFKKLHLKQTMNGKKLLTVHIEKVDGIKIYSGIWVTQEYFSREAKKLLAYGISTPR